MIGNIEEHCMVVKLFILGLPGSGKSSVARYIRTYVRDKGWVSDHFNDYGILQRMFCEDIEGKQFKPTAHKGFDIVDFTAFDIALQILEFEVQRYISQNQNKKLLLIEFSRNNYRHAFSQFSPEFLKDAYFLYLDVNIENCKKRIRERITNPSTANDYFVSDYIFNAYYNQDDGQDIPDILVRDFKIENSRVKIINNGCSLMEASKEINPFIDHIYLKEISVQLARRY